MGGKGSTRWGNVKIDNSPITLKLNAVDGYKEIDNILTRVKDAKIVMKSIMNFMRSKVIDHFRNEEGSTGKWQSLSPVTIALRRKGKGTGGPKILQDTGDLLNSIQGGTGGVSEYTSKYAKVGTTIFYAKFHEQPDNSGPTNSKKGILPKRDFMFLKTSDIEEMKKIISIYFLNGK